MPPPPMNSPVSLCGVGSGGQARMTSPGKQRAPYNAAMLTDSVRGLPSLRARVRLPVAAPTPAHSAILARQRTATG